jgi:plasmid stabilization system protein ParE
MPDRAYILTETAVADFKAARDWSMRRWGKELTISYFQALHEAAEELAKNHFGLPSSTKITACSELLVWPVREHYLVYTPAGNQRIIIVALIRQTRDVPAILAENRFLIERALKKIQQP